MATGFFCSSAEPENSDALGLEIPATAGREPDKASAEDDPRPMTIYTDNPRDPCGYCCGWIFDPDEEFRQNQIPINVDGSVVERMYRRGHKRCLAMVAEYMAEHEGDVS